MRKLMGYELRKLFGRRLTQAALLAAVLFSTLFTVSTYQNKYASYGGRQASGGEAVALDKEVAARYAGKGTPRWVARVSPPLPVMTGDTRMEPKAYRARPSRSDRVSWILAKCRS